MKKIAAGVAAVLLLAGCGSGAVVTERTVTATPSDTFTPPSVEPVPSVSIQSVPDDPSPSPTKTRLTAKERDRFIKLLYAKYTEEWVTNPPGDWLSLARTACNAYGRGVTDEELLEQLTDQLSYGAARWFLASVTTLVCPEYGG